MSRIEIGGYVMKWVGSCWVVGELVPRTINGRRTEEVRRPHYEADGARALGILMGLTQTGDDPLRRSLEDHVWLCARSRLYAPGVRVRELRKAMGLSRHELASRSKVSVRTIRRIETDDAHEAKAVTLARLLTALESDRG